jgi:FkbM family methyltransferase
MISLLEAAVNAKSKFTMVELGAGIGHQVIQAAGALRAYHGPDFPFELIAVEGEPTAFKWMHDHFATNNVDPTHHQLIEAVVSDKDGSVLFEVGFPEGFGSFVVSPFRHFTNPARWIYRFIKRIYKQIKGHKLVPTDYWTGSKGLGIYTRKCKAVSLNSLLRDLESVDYLHIDIFEQEVQVLKPAIEQIEKKVKKIHIETHTAKAEKELWEMFNARGWKCVNNFPKGGVRKTEYGRFDFIDGVQTWINNSLDDSVRSNLLKAGKANS